MTTNEPQDQLYALAVEYEPTNEEGDNPNQGDMLLLETDLHNATLNDLLRKAEKFKDSPVKLRVCLVLPIDAPEVLLAKMIDEIPGYVEILREKLKHLSTSDVMDAVRRERDAAFSTDNYGKREA